MSVLELKAPNIRIYIWLMMHAQSSQTTLLDVNQNQIDTRSIKTSNCKVVGSFKITFYPIIVTTFFYILNFKFLLALHWWWHDLIFSMLFIWLWFRLKVLIDCVLCSVWTHATCQTILKKKNNYNFRLWRWLFSRTVRQ